MKTKILGLFTLITAVLTLNPRGLAQSAPATFPEPLSPRIANYRIDVKLDPDTRLITGHEEMTWRNTADAPVSDVQLHLYQNAFRNNQSTFIQEAGPKEAEKKLGKDGWGFIDLDSVKTADGQDLTGRVEFIHPDDDNQQDRTVVRIPLPEPVAPGAELVLQIDFTERLPEPPFARSGSKKEFFFVSQWFPKVGVFENGAWNCHQYHSHSEFFADYGVYDVRMTVPAANLVGATGTLVERTDHGDGTATHWYHAEDVHDFAWTTSPRFVEVTGQSQDVKIRVLMQKERAYQGERHLKAAQLAVQYFQNWYGDYPFPNLTVVDPRRKAAEAGGMEYPTLITAGTTFAMPRGLRAVEMVVIHEFGHNYWYHLVGTNEFEEPWLDEGVNTYSEIKIMHAIYGADKSFVDFLGLKGDDLQMRRSSYIQLPDADPIVRTSWGYYNGASYRTNAYSKPALGLLTLDNHLGTDRFTKCLAAWLARYRFKHPTTRDFINTVNETAGENLDWFFDQMFNTNRVLDYAVTSVESREVRPGKGYDYTLCAPGAPECRPEVKGSDSNKNYLSVVKVRRLGGFEFPVELAVEFDDGEVVREQWDGRDTWHEWKYLRSAKLVKATVDPDEKVVLDLNWNNNSKSVAQQEREGLLSPIPYLDMVKFVLHPPQ